MFLTFVGPNMFLESEAEESRESTFKPLQANSKLAKHRIKSSAVATFILFRETAKIYNYLL